MNFLRKNFKYIICILIIGWIIASFIDVNIHNMTTCEYASWNAFELLMKGVEMYDGIGCY